VAIRRKLRHSCEPHVAVVASVVIGKVSLVRVRHPLSAGAELVAPHERLSAQPAASGELPFRLRWQALAGPLCVRFGVLVRDVDDGIVLSAFDAAGWTERMPPVGAVHVGPPAKVSVERDWMIWR